MENQNQQKLTDACKLMVCGQNKTDLTTDLREFKIFTYHYQHIYEERNSIFIAIRE